MAGACSEACPKGVDPAMGAQLLKKKIIFGGRKKTAKPAGTQINPERKPNISNAPERTINK